MGKFLDNTIGKQWYLNHPTMTNCGSYAFNILEWYSPWPKKQTPENIVDLYLNADWSNLGSLTKQILDICTKRILKDFADKNIKKLKRPRKPNSNQDLIAFRIGILPGDFDNSTDVDFHFRVFRDNQWSEKSGSEQEIKFCEFSEDTWFSTTDLIYDSPIIYFLKDRS